jgi:MoaA/NifB/PqqE/SkfB family radical SAM enzyme
MKNRNRDPYTFANINLLGKCNVNCYFCLGKDIEDILSKHNQIKVTFLEWKNFSAFLDKCRQESVKKLYITGQNTDPLLYEPLGDLIDYLHSQGFLVGLRTNGYLAEWEMETIAKCDLSVGYTIPSIYPEAVLKMTGKKSMPDWEWILYNTRRPRPQIPITRYNINDLFETLEFLSGYPNIPYIQVRRLSTDTRQELLQPDIALYDQLCNRVAKDFRYLGPVFGAAAEYEIFEKRVCFWPTVSTTVNSLNYFTDGTISDLYFIVEGYLKANNIELVDLPKVR